MFSLYRIYNLSIFVILSSHHTLHILFYICLMTIVFLIDILFSIYIDCLFFDFSSNFFAFSSGSSSSSSSIYFPYYFFHLHSTDNNSDILCVDGCICSNLFSSFHSYFSSLFSFAPILPLIKNNLK
jgi:hypothetical protein